MKNLTLEHIAQACHGTYVGADELNTQEISAVTTDSRKVEAGCLFVPIVGARVDGHNFIEQVMAAGALCTLSEKDLGEVAYPYIKVASSLQAVKDLAAFYLDQLQIPVIGITGSVGKTSTKEMIAAVLAEKYCVLKTQGNFNNELGLPLTVFRLREGDEIAILEMGISDFNEMHRLAAVARPNTSVITNIGTCHLENLGDRDGVLRAKTEVFDHLKENANVILNGDDDKLATVAQVQGKAPTFFGMNPEYPIYADKVESRGLKGIFCCIHTPKGSFEVVVPIPGIHMVYNALAGTAVGLAYGMELEEIKRGIEKLQPVSGRFNIIETEKYTIVDDCYNANPMSMKASLQIMKDALGRKVAILGDMGELGATEKELHAQVGTFAGDCGIDKLICVGKLCEEMVKAARISSEAAGNQLEIIHLDTLDETIGKLSELVKEKDTILVKASHFMQFDKIVKALQV